ncbi:MAG: hypothetical protein QXW40_08220, partial [Thermofilum sp.]
MRDHPTREWATASAETEAVREPNSGTSTSTYATSVLPRRNVSTRPTGLAGPETTTAEPSEKTTTEPTGKNL